MISITDNTVYYTLSTISQTMAALFAVVGTFELFEIQSTETRLRDMLRLKAGRDTLGEYTEKIMLLIAARKYEEAFKAFPMSSWEADSAFISGDITYLTKSRIFLKSSLIWSTSTILTSVLLLGVYDLIKKFPFSTYLFYFACAVFTVSLTLIANKMYVTFKG